MNDDSMCGCCSATESEATEECQWCGTMKCTKCDKGTSFPCAECESHNTALSSAIAAAETRIAELEGVVSVLTNERDRALSRVREESSMRVLLGKEINALADGKPTETALAQRVESRLSALTTENERLKEQLDNAMRPWIDKSMLADTPPADGGAR